MQDKEKQEVIEGKKGTRIQSPGFSPIPKRLYTVDEASIYLSRSPWMIRYMMNTGQIPFIEDGRKKLLDVLDMDSWIEEHKKNGQESTQ